VSNNKEVAERTNDKKKQEKNERQMKSNERKRSGAQIWLKFLLPSFTLFPLSTLSYGSTLLNKTLFLNLGLERSRIFY